MEDPEYESFETDFPDVADIRTVPIDQLWGHKVPLTLKKKHCHVKQLFYLLYIIRVRVSYHITDTSMLLSNKGKLSKYS